MGQALHTADRCGLCHRRHAPAKGRTIGFDDLLAHGRIGELDPERFPRALGDLLAATTLGELEVEDMKGRYLG